MALCLLVEGILDLRHDNVDAAIVGTRAKILLPPGTTNAVGLQHENFSSLLRFGT